MSDLWLTDILMTEPLAGATTTSEEFEIGLEFSNELSNGCLSACLIKPFSIFCDSKTWTGLALAVLLHSVLMCLLWYSPKPHAQSLKCMEVQLVSLKGDECSAGPGLEDAQEPGPPSVQSGAEMSGGEKINQEIPPPEIKSLPSEKRNDVRQNTPLTKHAQSVPPRQKEKKPAVQLHPVHTDSPSQSDTVHERAALTAGAGAEAAISQSPGAGAAASSNTGSSGGSGVEGGGRGTVERAFGAPDGPSFLHRVVPAYPAFAKKLEKQGTVLLRVTIDERGRPAAVEILQKAGFGLDEEAVRAIKESTFVPAKRDGQPLTCKALLPIRFVLKES